MSDRVEQLVVEIATMNRGDLANILKKLNCHFEMDFTDEYLESLSLERLRHVALAAILHADGVAVA
jgi:hypothetical protein